MENNSPVQIKELKSVARGQLIGKYGIAILATLIVASFEYIALTIEMNLVGSDTMGFLISLVISIIVNLLFGVLTYGEAVFFLKLARGDKSLSVADIFSGVKGLFDKTIMIEGVFVAFSILGLLPSIALRLGIVAVPDKYYDIYSYGELGLQLILLLCAKLYFGLSFYILHDHQAMDVKDVLKESLSLMTRKKGRLFLIYLSSLPLALAGLCACGVGILWFNVYFQTMLANFYLYTIGEMPKRPGSTSPTDSQESGCSTLDIRL